MRFRHWMLVSALVAALSGECGGSDKLPKSGADPSWESSVLKESATPEEVVVFFFEAFCQGNSTKTMAMLTKAARQEAAKHGFEVAPSGSKTATFKVGQVEYIHQTLARVPARWSDIDPDGQKAENGTTWMLRRRPEGWRITGVAATVFPGKPPFLVNFENLAEMQQMRAARRNTTKADHPARGRPSLEQEYARRANLRAHAGEGSSEYARRRNTFAFRCGMLQSEKSPGQ